MGLVLAIYIALGANQSAQYNGGTVSPAETFLLAIVQLQQSGVDLVGASNLWQSPAWPDPNAQPSYINAVIKVRTELEPIELLALLKSTEAAFGRMDAERNAPRPLDLDILDYNGQVLENKALILPHSRMLDRPFVLFPLAEVAPSWTDPIKKRAISEWIARLKLADVAPMQRLGVLL